MSGFSRYGDITRIKTTGASLATANQDRLGYSGVEASHALMKTDLQRANSYKPVIYQVARAQQIDPALIGAIASRESRVGAALENGWGDQGNAFGLMQVDRRWHSPQGSYDSEEHLMQATGILVGMIGAMEQKFPSWTREQQLKGGYFGLELPFEGALDAGEACTHDGADKVYHFLLLLLIMCNGPSLPDGDAASALAAYNMGPGNVHSYDNVDANTTGRDYSNDVIARAQWLKRTGF